MAKWTAADVPDQSGRTFVVTGANSGIGLVTARELARAGATVIMGCRSAEKAQAAVDGIRQAVPGAQVEVQALDLADLTSVTAFAGVLHERGGPVHVLVNNAGVMATPQRTTADGFELQLGTNHLGHFALTGRLMDLLLAAEQPRVVTLASGAHRMGRMNFGDLNSERGYSKWRAYGQSKLANLLFTFELQRRALDAGTSLLALAAHPGYAATNLQAVGPKLSGNRIEERLMGIGNRLLAQSDEQGAWPTLYAATMPNLAPASYIGPDGLMEMRGHPKLVGSSSAARDRDAQRRLWERSEELTGVHFEFTRGAAAA